MKLKKIIDSKNSLQKLAIQNAPIKFLWDLKKFIIAVNPELQAYEEIRNQKIKEYGTINKEGNPEITPDNPKMQTFLSEMEEMENKEIDIVVPTITFDKFSEYLGSGKTTLTAADLMVLDYIIVE